MSVSLRIFLVNDDDSIQRLPLSRYERLIRGDAEERLPQYAGKRVRYAEVAVELVERKPVEIIRLEHFIMYFDSEGRLDLREKKKERRLSVDMIPPLLPQWDSDQVIDAHHRFAKKSFEHQYKWTPSPTVEEAIVQAVFGKDRV